MSRRGMLRLCYRDYLIVGPQQSDRSVLIGHVDRGAMWTALSGEATMMSMLKYLNRLLQCCCFKSNSIGIISKR